MNNIREKRKQADLTQEQLAKALAIDRSTVAKWESGESMPRAQILPKLAEILECTIDEIFKVKEQEEVRDASPA